MEQKLTKLEAIFQWDMTVPEAEAYKTALIWEILVDKHAPDSMKTPEWHRRNHISKRGDPRKSYLFKQCWKLCRQTRGLLKEGEMPLYIGANLVVLKAHNAYMEVNTICGDQAWLRWKIWKRHFDKKMAEINNNPPPPVAEDKVVRHLLRDKRFIFERCDGEVTKEKMEDFISKGIFKVWVMQSKVSMYYVTMSPFVAPYLEELGKTCGFDPALFKEKIDGTTSLYFRTEFEHEFDS